MRKREEEVNIICRRGGDADMRMERKKRRNLEKIKIMQIVQVSEVLNLQEDVKRTVSKESNQNMKISKSRCEE